ARSPPPCPSSPSSSAPRGSRASDSCRPSARACRSCWQVSRPRREGEGRRADADSTPGAGGGPSRRGRGSRGTAPGRPRSGPAAGAGQARLAAANGGSWRRFGGWAEGSPSPTAAPPRGEGNRLTTKRLQPLRRELRSSDRPRIWGQRSCGAGEHYKHHWFPEKPCKGSGYRCIRINHKMDPLIGQAAQRIGLSSQELFRLLPSELTLWVDPYEVSYRIGEDGSICVLYEASPAGGSTQNSSSVQMVDSRISCKEELLLGRTSPSKNYNMMTVSG
uniref:Protein BTG1 n=1 Tax=Felis catus TaxID=9685 RepID=A0ABI7YN25_FELCA